MMIKGFTASITAKGIFATAASINIQGAGAILIGLGVGTAIIVGAAGFMYWWHSNSKKQA